MTPIRLTASMNAHALLGGAIILVIVVGPVVWALAARGGPEQANALPRPHSEWPWRLVVGSTLQCVLAFNLVFITQEVLLVVPKAMTPGLRPTLFHNNHTWEGNAPLGALFQGTGAVGLLCLACAALLILRLRQPLPLMGRLFITWIAYQAVFQALPQFVVAGFGQGDLSQAMDFLELSPVVSTGIALGALAVLAPAAVQFARLFLRLAVEPSDRGTGEGPRQLVFQIAVVPALLAIPLIVPFRVPRELTEVVLPPVIASGVGSAWMMAAAPRLAVRPVPTHRFGSLGWTAAACLALLLTFQLVLRPGIAFF